MDNLGNKKLQKSCDKYYCQYCEYNTSRKSSYDKHIKTEKHIKFASGNGNKHVICVKLQKSCKVMCEICNKEFQNRSGLWKHNKKYHNTTDLSNDEKYFNETNVNTETLSMLVQQNKDMLEILTKFIKNENKDVQ